MIIYSNGITSDIMYFKGCETSMHKMLNNLHFGPQIWYANMNFYNSEALFVFLWINYKNTVILITQNQKARQWVNHAKYT